MYRHLLIQMAFFNICIISDEYSVQKYNDECDNKLVNECDNKLVDGWDNKLLDECDNKLLDECDNKIAR